MNCPQNLDSCLRRAENDARDDISAAYSHALTIVRKRKIPCLKIEDTFTTGLTDRQWNALVLQEGAVSKESGAPGGSFGIGKNAVMNVSDLQTVFYSTRYVQGRKGRVEKLQGKATLIGHSDHPVRGTTFSTLAFTAKRGKLSTSFSEGSYSACLSICCHIISFTEHKLAACLTNVVRCSVRSAGKKCE